MSPDQLNNLISIASWVLDAMPEHSNDTWNLTDLANDLDTTVSDLESLRHSISELVHPRHPAPIEAELRLHLSQISALLAFSRTVRRNPSSPQGGPDA